MPAGLSVLIIDSSFQSRSALTMALIHEEYRVAAAQNGQSGLVMAWRDHPDIIFLNLDLPDMSGIEIVRQLRKEQSTAQLPVVGYSDMPNPVIMRAFLEAGGTEFINKNVKDVRNISEVMPSLMKQEELAKSATKGGSIIAFLSAKGGVGTSSLCANIGNAISRSKADTSVAVVDLVLPIGSIAPIVGYEGNISIVSVTAMDENKITPEFFLNNLPPVKMWNIHLLAGSSSPEEANAMQAGKIEKVIKTMANTFDYVLVDMGRALSRISMPIIQEASAIALVTGTDVSAVSLTKTVWTYLHSQNVDQKRIYGILNRAVGLEGLTKSEAEAMIGFPIQATVPYMGGNFALANNRHEPVTIKFPTDTAAMMIQQIATQLPQLAQRIRVTTGQLQI